MPKAGLLLTLSLVAAAAAGAIVQTTEDNNLGLSASLLTDALYTNPQVQQVLATLAAGGSPTEWTKLEPLAHMLLELRDRYRTA
jgi:hypothetical protein